MAYYALHHLHILPSVLMEMDDQEKAFLFAAIDIKLKKDQEAAEKQEKEVQKITARAKARRKGR